MKVSVLCVVALGVAVGVLATFPARAESSAERKVDGRSNGIPVSHPFSAAEVKQFLEQAKRAEAIGDPLKRCLAYPDPPGSHWSRAATHAYCNYHMQPFMGYDGIKALIEDGKASKLDEYLANALKKELTRPESAGLLDHIYFAHFADSSPETRTLIDSWKRQAPNSAFALAASGWSYVQMGWQARGGKTVGETPADNFVAMRHWLDQASADLERAIAVDPRVLPAYAAMINIGMLEGDDEYAARAATKGLSVQPSNYSVYGQIVWMAEPKWGGSIEDMERWVGGAQLQAKNNGLLQLLLPLPAAYGANLTDCNCDEPADPNAYRTILDQMPAGEILAGAANAVDRHGLANLAVVYQSEVIRFSPWASLLRAKRIRYLAASDEKAWAMAEANELSHTSPQSKAMLLALLEAYRSLGDGPAIERVSSLLNADPQMQ